jgi:hypothetical protein
MATLRSAEREDDGMRKSDWRGLAPAACLLVVGLFGCGGGAPHEPSTPPSPDAAKTEGSAKKPDAHEGGKKVEAAPKDASADDDKHEDPHESAEPIRMASLFGKGQKPKFPKASTGDRECWEKIELTGDHQKDYDNLISKCGAATGLLEYAKPVMGKLHHKHDQRDTYIVNLTGGYCYRYFAVADGSMTDLDILITQKSGAIVADDKTKSPVAIIHNDKPWCMDEDTEYHFQVEVDGPGKGHYLFAVWARPKK